MHEDTRTHKKYLFEEWALHSLAMRYQMNGRIAEAIAILQLSAETFPYSWSTHQNLAEAYLENGNKKSAIASYEQALEINSGNVEIKQALETLRESFAQ
jgi:tetratricopeptide (TPR) repeat protein